MNPPTIDFKVDLNSERVEEEKMEGGSMLYCDLCDTEVVYKLAQMLLPGLATSCVDSTAGSFKTPGSVAVDLRKEMIIYITQRSETFVAESIVLDGGPNGEESDHPFDIISNFVDDFAISKRNLFTRVSGLLLTDMREDKIDDFMQEMELTGFWPLERRETIAEAILKNVDIKNEFHCAMKFRSVDDLAVHAFHCNFRPLFCENEGCNARLIAKHLEKHDSICPFKIIPCEQKCSDSIMRRAMDRHCITVCPMKLVDCPFHSLGCRSAIAQCVIEKHCADDVRSHLWHLLKGMYKQASGEDLQRRVQQIVQASPGSRLAEARDVRSLNFVVKDIEAKLGPFELGSAKKNSTETLTKNNGGKNVATNANGSEESSKTPDLINSSHQAEVSAEKKNSVETIANNNNGGNSVANAKGSGESTKAPDMGNSSNKAERSFEKKNIAETVAEYDDGRSSVTNTNGSEESTNALHMVNLYTTEVSADKKDSLDITTNEKGSEESTEALDMVDLLEKVEARGIIHMDSSENTENKDGKHSHIESRKSNERETIHIESNGSEERTQSCIESKSNEVDKQNPIMASLSNEDETSLMNMDGVQMYIKTKDGEGNGEYKFKGNEESTQTNMKNLSDKGEISAANEDSAENSTVNKHIGSNSFEDEDNEQRIQNPKMETNSNAQHNVNNKDIDDEDLEEKLQLQASKVQHLSDKAHVMDDKGYAMESDVSERLIYNLFLSYFFLQN
ncbi:uncharacterized protein LOC107492584 [Arachis duranensis]|uniref:Uncharacterized protein LOC107492584 n=1 Tax=Arachis duranensis TaxID=130453 RepID=A0A9C6WUU7_ARADU|nr:uncharacterized protein LOC107492584 [Arachis duranensis]